LFYYTIWGILLPSDAETQLQSIRKKIIHGEFHEALEIIEAGLKKKEVIKVEKLRFLVLKSEILNDLGKFKEALDLAEDVLKEFKSSENQIILVDALIQKTYAIFLLTGNFEEGEKYSKEAFEILDAIPTTNISLKERAERKSQLMIFFGWRTAVSGDFDKAIELFTNAHSFAIESCNKRIIVKSIRYLVGINVEYRFFKEAEKWLLKVKEIALEIGNKVELYYCNLLHAYILGRGKREFNQAIKLFDDAVSIGQEIGMTDNIVMRNYEVLGLIYRAAFQLDKAIDCFKTTLEIPWWDDFSVLGNLGYTYYLKNDYEKAHEYLMIDLKVTEEMGNQLILPNLLLHLIVISIELNNLQQAEQYLSRLEQISNETGFEQTIIRYRFASILVLKSSGNISDLGQAAELLKAFLTEGSLSPEMRLDSLYALMEIRIKELQLSVNKEALEEAKKQIIRLEVEAEEQKLPWLLANIYRLHSQLALIELDAQKAIEFLEKAQEIAQNIDLKLLSQKIKDDREKISQQLKMLHQLQDQKATINETVKLVSLEKTIESIKKETVLEERDKETGEIIEYRKLFALKI
jgi:tetratricopeptide (TPR) repeat protein